jgi:hypothetical protein
MGSAEGRGPVARGIGGYRGLKRAFVSALPKQIVRGGFGG